MTFDIADFARSMTNSYMRVLNEQRGFPRWDRFGCKFFGCFWYQSSNPNNVVGRVDYLTESKYSPDIPHMVQRRYFLRGVTFWDAASNLVSVAPDWDCDRGM